MQTTKFYLHSKRFWGFLISMLGLVATLCAQYAGHDISTQVQAVGSVLLVFGIPFHFYGSAIAEQPLGTKPPITQ